MRNNTSSCRSLRVEVGCESVWCPSRKDRAEYDGEKQGGVGEDRLGMRRMKSAAAKPSPTPACACDIIIPTDSVFVCEILIMFPTSFRDSPRKQHTSWSSISLAPTEQREEARLVFISAVYSRVLFLNLLLVLTDSLVKQID